MRRIDHLVVAVRDLEAAGAFYGQLGFQVGARNRHPWGTENRLIQFGSSFIELITVGEGGEAIPPHAPGRFSFGAFVRDFLRSREGLAMLVLDSEDAKRDAAAFAAAGLGTFEPFFFERKGRRPDGSETHLAFTLAFAVDAASPEIGFFVCQQHFPENFWNAGLQRHPNGATGICAVTMTAPDPPRHRAFLSAFTGERPASRESGAMSFRLADGRIDLRASGPSGPLRLPRLHAIEIPVTNLEAQRERLRQAAVRHAERPDALVVEGDAAAGVEIVFSAN